MPLNVRRRTLLGASAAAVVGGGTVTGVAYADEEQPLIGPATGDEIHVISFNINNAGEDPPHSWEERRILIKELLLRERPTVIGTQEGIFLQGREMRADLEGYDWVHLSRQGGGADESAAVLFDTSRLTATTYAHRWLSDTPKEMGSTSWGHESPRMMTWVRFTDSATDKDFILLNTHFDHESQQAREKSAAQVLATAADFDAPVIVTGDFNTAHGTEPYETLIGDGTLADTWETAAERLTPGYATYNAWEPEPVEGDRIDWILASPDISVAKTAINPWSVDGLPPSDHWPVQSLVKLP